LIVSFIAEGEPRTKGSWTLAPRAGGGRPVFLPGKDAADRDRYDGWIETVQLFARREMGMRDPINGAIQAEIVFVLPKPKSVRRVWPQSQNDGDLDKLERAVYDACESIIYTNDARICSHRNLKRYVDTTAGERPHAAITFTEIGK
jgi:Holliday junction resolvase RusA-like endonuclease